MILLQLSSGQGPIECCQAIGLAIKAIEKECRTKNIELTLVDTVLAEHKGGFKSALLKLESTEKEMAKELALSSGCERIIVIVWR